MPGLLLLLLNNKKKLFSLRSHQMRQGERERVGSGPIAASHRSYWGGDSSVFLSLSFSPFFIYIYFPSFFYIFYDDSFFYVYVGTGRRRPFWDSTDPISRLYISVTFLSFSLSLLLPARVLQEKEDRKKNDRREWGKEKGVGFLLFSVLSLCSPFLIR